MMDWGRGWRALTLNGIPLTCCGFVKFGEWCRCLRCCKARMQFRSHLPPVNMQMHPNHLSCLCLEESSRRINKAKKLSFKKKVNLWVPSAPSGGHRGHQTHIFAAAVTLLSTAHEWLWNWPFYWIWWSITAQMEVWLPQGTGDIA